MTALPCGWEASADAARRPTCLTLALLVLLARPTPASPATADGLFKLRAGTALAPSDSPTADPSFLGRLTVDGHEGTDRLHAVLEGGWDGTVRPPSQNRRLVRDFATVYQDPNPFLEVKELYLERTFGHLDLTAGIQRFAWGRLDEYPVNDLLNPWDYTEFLIKPIEERKIGVPALAASSRQGDWGWQAVWVPLHVPYRLAKPGERWSGLPTAGLLAGLPGAEIRPSEPERSGSDPGHGSLGLRLQRLGGELGWTATLFHGQDPRPVFRSTALRVSPDGDGRLLVDPGLAPGFARITSLGFDLDTVLGGSWSLRAEAAYSFQRAFNVRPELWGYPTVPQLGLTPLPAIEVTADTLDYGLAVDHRLFEDGLLTLQAQQTVLPAPPAGLYERRVETLLWANLKVGWLNQRLDTSLNLALNPEHGGEMLRAKVYYSLSDTWKAGLTLLALDGQPPSLFGRYGGNDQVELELIRAW